MQTLRLVRWVKVKQQSLQIPLPCVQVRLLHPASSSSGLGSSGLSQRGHRVVMNEILKSSRMLGRFARMGVLLCAFVSAAVFAETVVSGAIAVNTTWRTADGPFVVNGDVNVQNNAVLTIEAGTQIYMASGTNLSVNAGTVRALGTTSAPILVRSNKVRAGQAPAAPSQRSRPAPLKACSTSICRLGACSKMPT